MTTTNSGPAGSLPQAKVEDRENVSTVKPSDYPKCDRDDGAVTGADNRGRRASKGSGPVSGSGAGAGGKGYPEDYDSDAQAGGGTAGMRTDPRKPVEKRRSAAAARHLPQSGAC
ncbi:hypothetical protein CDQ92_08760 [Sphingopyxis bauzanensis]|uniref:Uncharacterized protein n=1 Tax=Sphingopyxis bauzanensis TaxID=651663 RepID=A0A246JVP8_9SPHN|nr:hypothetical protein [Sphingopyxis bauzanensis]OWQ97151.1 hypothetical protein CDQ92_08760 [Sphingopyxis bauzanensis]GGJ47669.1 hypothetical protein GCM10011393_17300 [Sphingopyxis bauzanensis]